jgi:hypothetical protein
MSILDDVKYCNCACKSDNLDYKPCLLSKDSCCWCMDKRDEVMVTKFVDGIGLLGIKYIPRDVDYCKNCRITLESFSVIVDELKKDMTRAKREEITRHMKELAKRQYRRSPKYMDFRLKFYLNLG